MSAWSRLYEDEINKTSSLDEYIYNKLRDFRKSCVNGNFYLPHEASK